MKKIYRWKGKDREFEVRPMDTSNWEECDVLDSTGILCGHSFDERFFTKKEPLLLGIPYNAPFDNAPHNFLVNVKFSKKCREHGIEWACEWCFEMLSQTVHELGYSYL